MGRLTHFGMEKAQKFVVKISTWGKIVPGTVHRVSAFDKANGRPFVAVCSSTMLAY